MNIMRPTVIFLLALSVNGQTNQKVVPHKTAPQQMSHDFRTAGRRALAAIADVDRRCITRACSLDDYHEVSQKADTAIEEADAQHDNAVDKQALELLKEYNAASFYAWLRVQPTCAKGGCDAICTKGACDAMSMYRTCKKEAEEVFENGTLPAKQQCDIFLMPK